MSLVNGQILLFNRRLPKLKFMRADINADRITHVLSAGLMSMLEPLFTVLDIVPFLGHRIRALPSIQHNHSQWVVSNIKIVINVSGLRPAEGGPEAKQRA